MKHFTLPMLVVALLLFSACDFKAGSASGKPSASVQREIAIPGSYDELDVASAFRVTVSDDVTAAVVTLPGDNFDKLEFRVDDGTLHIRLRSALPVEGTPSVVLPRNPLLTDVELAGASSFSSPYPLKGSEVNVELSGASSFTADVEASEVDIDLSGASEYQGNVAADVLSVEANGASRVTLAGEAGRMDINLSGASHCAAGRLEAYVVEGKVSGASNADVTCRQKLDVKVSGASLLTYGGNPTSLNAPATGASTVVGR